jgi:hypothetical protein
MAKRRRSRGLRGAGTIDQLPSGRWRLRVPQDTGGRATYGTYDTEELAAKAQARWQLTRLLPGGFRRRGLLLQRPIPRIHWRQAPERTDGRDCRGRHGHRSFAIARSDALSVHHHHHDHDDNATGLILRSVLPSSRMQWGLDRLLRSQA